MGADRPHADGQTLAHGQLGVPGHTGIDLLTLVAVPGFGFALCCYGVLMALDMTDPPTSYSLIPLAVLLVPTVAAAGATLRTRVAGCAVPAMGAGAPGGASPQAMTGTAARRVVAGPDRRTA